MVRNALMAEREIATFDWLFWAETMQWGNLTTLEPCVPDPGKIVCVGLNYRRHAAEAGLSVPETPILFSKYANSLAAHGDEVVIPAVTEQADYEAELVIVMGRRAKEVSEEMVFSAKEVVSYISHYMTLEPGDLILTGTPEGVIFGDVPTKWLRAGDEVTIEVEGLGRLTNVMTSAASSVKEPQMQAGAHIFPSLVPVRPDDSAAPANREAWAALERFDKPFLTAFSDRDPITKGASTRSKRACRGRKVNRTSRRKVADISCRRTGRTTSPNSSPRSRRAPLSRRLHERPQAQQRPRHLS